MPDKCYSIFNQDWIKKKNIINDSKKNITGDTLFVGCSVANQFWPYNKNNQLTSDALTFPIGNYILIANILKNNPHVKTVVYLSVPDMLGLSLSNDKTYNLFVKPFYTIENFELINSSNLVKKVLNRNPLLYLCFLNSFKVAKMDDYNYRNEKNKKNDWKLSDESIEWILKIKILCEINSVKFYLASPPVPYSKKIKSSNWDSMRKQVAKTEIEKLFNSYLNTIKYLDDKFSKDNLHWKSEFVSQNSSYIRNEIIKSIRDGNY